MPPVLRLLCLCAGEEGLPQDSPKACQLYQRAAEGGFDLNGPPNVVTAQIKARYMLGTLYALGDGVDQDRATGAALWQQAEAQERALHAVDSQISLAPGANRG